MKNITKIHWKYNNIFTNYSLFFFLFLLFNNISFSQIKPDLDQTRTLTNNVYSKKIAKQVYKHLKQFHSLYSYQDELLKIATDATPEKYNKNRRSISKDIKGLNKIFSHIEKHNEKFQMPISIFKSSSYDPEIKMKNLLSKNFNNQLTVLISLYKNSKGYHTKLNNLEEFAIEVNTKVQLSASVKETLYKVYKELQDFCNIPPGATLPIYSKTCLLTLGIGTETHPLSNRILVDLRRKSTSLDKLIKQDRIKFHNYVSNTKLLTQNVIDSYNKELSKVSYKKLQASESIKDFFNDFSKVSNLKDKIKTYNQKSKKYNSKNSEKNTLIANIRQLENELSNVIKQLDNLNFKCPKNYSYNNCNHESLKKIYNQNLNLLNSNYDYIKNKISLAKSQLTAFEKKIKKELEKLNTEFKEIEDLQKFAITMSTSSEKREKAVKTLENNLQEQIDNDFLVQELNSKIELLNKLMEKINNLI
jgi:hypothetical protein